MTDTRKLARTAGLLGLLLVLALVGVRVTGHGPRWLLPAVPPAPPMPEPYAPSEVHAFIRQAKAADAIADPLQRCLAYPDIPGNHWPPGLARAFCDLTYGPYVSLHDITDALDREDAAALDVAFARDLDRHFSESDFSEAIHHDFEDIDANDDAEQITRRWLEKAPSSPFAQAARARYLRKVAEAARENGDARDVTYVRQATSLYQQALKTEPRLMPAYGGLIALALMDSDADALRSAYRRGAAMDPGCAPLNRALMFAIGPKWGGDYQAMFALSKRLSADLGRRPLLAYVMVEPLVERSDEFYDAKRYQDSIDILTVAAAQGVDPELFEDMARAQEEAHPGRPWDRMVYALESTRFGPSRGFLLRQLGQDLLDTVHEPMWSIRVLEKSVADEPDEIYGHYLLARSYAAARQDGAAEHEYLIAMGDPGYRHMVLIDLVRMAEASSQPAKVRMYKQQLAREFPGKPAGQSGTTP